MLIFQLYCIMSTKRLSYEGCAFFRQRVILSVISGTSMRVKRIRTKGESPGVRDFEANLLHLIDSISAGCSISISSSGTSVSVTPGLLIGGKLEHNCSTERGLGYYLEALLYLAPFTKEPLDVTLIGVTAGLIDPSVDQIRLSCLPVLNKFLGTDEGVEIKIIQRGVAPTGGGIVNFRCPCRYKLCPLQMVDSGKVKKVRGIATTVIYENVFRRAYIRGVLNRNRWSVRVSPNAVNRMIEAAKGVLLHFLCDVFITSDSRSTAKLGRQMSSEKAIKTATTSPGFGITLVAETEKGSFFTAESCSHPRGSSEEPSIPEDLGKVAACELLDEINRGGCVDRVSQSLAILFMALGQKDVSKLLSAPPTMYTIHYLRHLKDFFNIVFKVEKAADEAVGVDGEKLRMGAAGERLILTCMGLGYNNINKRSF